jgi:hypothetical protein
MDFFDLPSSVKSSLEIAQGSLIRTITVLSHHLRATGQDCFEGFE